MPLQGFLEEFQCGLLFARLRHEALELFAFVVDGAPEIVLLTVDLHKDLVEVPLPKARPHALDAAFPDLWSKHGPEPVPPEPHRLVADIDVALVQQILDVAERQREPDEHHYRQADDFRARLEVVERAGSGHSWTFCGGPARLKRSSSDRALSPLRDVYQTHFGTLRCRREGESTSSVLSEFYPPIRLTSGENQHHDRHNL
jgi:hypothetical protein